jgi:hypothetical protein
MRQNKKIESTDSTCAGPLGLVGWAPALLRHGSVLGVDADSLILSGIVRTVDLTAATALIEAKSAFMRHYPERGALLCFFESPGDVLIDDVLVAAEPSRSVAVPSLDNPQFTE